jgi:hypothetical protein
MNTTDLRVQVRYERDVPHGTFDLAEGTVEVFDLDGYYRITLTCSRPEGSKETTILAAGSTPVEAGTFANLQALTGDASTITADAIEPFTEEAHELIAQLKAAHERGLAVARWRTGSSGSHGSIGGYKKQWSLDGSAWHDLPFGLGHMNIRAEIIKKWLPDVRSSYAELLRAGVAEPIAYNLLLEALRLRDGFPRSAVVIGVAALEVGVKQCIVDLAPDTDWLLTNLPSPPVVDLLSDYIPTLKPKVAINGGKMLKPPKAIRRILHQAVEARNRLVHRTGESLEGLDLEEVLKAVRDVLYLMEFYRGHKWAHECMRHEIVKSMMDEAGLT